MKEEAIKIIYEFVHCIDFQIENGYIEILEDALKKQIPMKPIYKEKTDIVHCSYADGTSGFKKNKYEDYFCPVCDWVVGERYNHPHFKKGYHDQKKSKFCNECGQAIDWSDEE